MTTLRSFRADDLYSFNHINLDPLTETYSTQFYTVMFLFLVFYIVGFIFPQQYLATWPTLCAVYDDANGRMMGYILGKAEGQGDLWHGHVTAVTVSPDYRRLGVASKLMDHLETVSEHSYNAFFVDLFVRVSNNLACLMYTGLGYTVFRQVLQYYSGEEDAFDMRKALPRDKDKKSIIPLARPIRPEELEW